MKTLPRNFLYRTPLRYRANRPIPDPPSGIGQYDQNRPIPDTLSGIRQYAYKVLYQTPPLRYRKVVLHIWKPCLEISYTGPTLRYRAICPESSYTGPPPPD